eukprot:COSAG03_NODE_5870_length_1158_cov_0.932011_1_plen_68_part_10
MNFNPSLLLVIGQSFITDRCIFTGWPDFTATGQDLGVCVTQSAAEYSDADVASGALSLCHTHTHTHTH